MKHSEIQVSFSVYIESELNHNKITEIVGCKPTEFWNKDEEIIENLYRKESAWILTITRAGLLHTDSLINELLGIIAPCKSALAEYVQRNELNVKFDIVLTIAEEEVPSHFLSKEFIHLCSLLNAEVDTDIYLK